MIIYILCINNNERNTSWWRCFRRCWSINWFIGIILFIVSIFVCLGNGASAVHNCRGLQTPELEEKCDNAKEGMKNSGISIGVGAGMLLIAAILLFINYYTSKKRL